MHQAEKDGLPLDSLPDFLNGTNIGRSMGQNWKIPEDDGVTNES